jgi:hypothetical protein
MTRAAASVGQYRCGRSCLLKLSRAAALFALATFLLPTAALAGDAAAPCGQAIIANMPARASTAPTGSEFARRVSSLSESDREAAIEAELLAGNMPTFLRKAAPVTLTGTLPDGRTTRVTVCVLVDYLAIGSDRDFLYVPMRLETALIVADRYHATLPTNRMVDATYDQAAVKLSPQPLPAGPEMRSTGYYTHHNEIIAEQRVALGAAPGVLTSGHKKDLVIANQLWQFPDRVAIYGWLRGSHDPIQPLSTWHGARYADYSHGARLVGTTIYVDGKSMAIFDALADPNLSRILNGDGPIPRGTQLVAMLAWRDLNLQRVAQETSPPAATTTLASAGAVQH